ncbi:MAG: hypothetical protein JXA15_02200 [Spirochaetales bacterium]|nr:hypothetical protein [Spirochaetales bacterium]
MRAFSAGASGLKALAPLAALLLTQAGLRADATAYDPDTLWRVAIVAFAVEPGSGAAAEKAASTVPSLLIAAISDLPEHRYSIEAARARGRRLAAVSRTSADRALAEARTGLDRLVFSPAAGEAERKRLEEAYRVALRNAEEAAAGDAEVPVPPAKPIGFHAVNKAGRPLELKVSVPELAATERIDMVLSGSVRRIGDYLAFTIEAWDRDLGMPVARIIDYSAPDDLESFVTRALPILREAVAGIEARRVVFGTDPPDATLSIIEASGSARALLQSERVVYLYGPLERTLVASAPGRETLSLALPGYGPDERIELTLPPLPLGPALSLESVPPGATLYLEGRKAGVAPLEVPAAPFPRVAEFRLEGFRPATFVLDPGSTRVPEAVLVPEAEALPMAIEARRDRFYDSLGWFVASLPVSVLSWQVYRSYYDAALLAGTSDPAYDKLSISAGAGGAAFAASAGVSAVLAGISALRLWHYIRSAD